jgi:polysaccharide pyruvyl transferase WcaK-like protein
VNAILVNDTSGTSNPGCQGTVHCLVEGVQRHGISIVSRVPVGYGYDVFSSSFKSPPLSIGQRMENRLRRICGAGRAAAVSPSPEKIDRSRWREAISIMYERLSPLWADAGLLLVNGEGTIHHDSVGALGLIGICAAAKRMRKKVAVVNCSIFELDESRLDTLRESVDYVSVREPMTFRYLKSNNIAATQSADCLFLAGNYLKTQAVSLRLSGPVTTPYVVYTPGVLSALDRINESTIAADIKAIRGLGRDVVYYVVETEDEKFASVAARAGASILPLGAVRWEQVQPFLAGAEWVVSGRYHINIFASMSGTPFIPLETNTAKMQGLLELLSCHNSQPVRKWNQTGAVDDVASMISPDAAIKISNGTIAKCAALAEHSVDFTSCLDLSKETTLAADNLPEMAEVSQKASR